MNVKEKLDEKWRPAKFTDLVGNQKIIDELVEMCKNKNISHLLFSGPAGTGKTSTAQVIVNDIFDGDTKRKFKEINASDDNGINVVRNSVKDFAKRSGIQSKVPFRIMILDEVDNMTPQAQAALRRTMELEYKHCRFILICNYPRKIIDPIKSRCTEYKYHKIKPEEMLPRLQYICDEEGISIDDDALEFICKQTDGDMRKALNSYLQKIKTWKKHVTIKMINELTIKSNVVEMIVKDALNGEFIDSRQLFMKQLFAGNEIRQIIKKISDYSIKNGFPQQMKGDICLICLNSEKLIIDGCSDELVVAGMIANLQKVGKLYKPNKKSNKK